MARRDKPKLACQPPQELQHTHGLGGGRRVGRPVPALSCNSLQAAPVRMPILPPNHQHPRLSFTRVMNKECKEQTMSLIRKQRLLLPSSRRLHQSADDIEPQHHTASVRICFSLCKNSPRRSVQSNHQHARPCRHRFDHDLERSAKEFFLCCVSHLWARGRVSEPTKSFFAEPCIDLHFLCSSRRQNVWRIFCQLA